MMVQKVAGGAHPGKLSPAELEALKTWIANGASETGEGAAVTAPTPGASASDAWTGGIDQIITSKCAICHVNTTSGGLSLKTYADALKGGQDGAAIVPGDPAKSVLIQVQQKGGHPGQLTPDELNRVIAWIKAGAPETPGAAAPTAPAATPTPAPNTWGAVAPILSAQCGKCHVDYAANNLSFKTYQDLLKGGVNGPAIVPGNPDNSLLVKVQKTGKHYGELSAADLEAIIAWIKAGAPEK